MELSPYLLVCSVCKGEYCSKIEWLRHLTSNGHQVIARENCLEKWSLGGGVKMRKRCVVVFSSFPLSPEEEPMDNNGGFRRGGGDKVVQYFSKKHTTFVTDFVRWEERPCIGILQFESKGKVKEIIPEPGGFAELTIDGQRVQVRRALDLLDLEWKAIMPVNVNNNSTSKREVSLGNLSRSTMNTNDIGSTIVNGKKRQLESAQLPIVKDSSSLVKKLKLRQDNVTSSDSPNSLQYQFANITKSIRIPDQVYNDTLTIQSAVQTLFRSNDPSAKAVMFRNLFLKLKSPNSDRNDLLFFVYNSRPRKWSKLSYRCIHSSVVDQMLLSPFGIENFSILKSAEQITSPTLDPSTAVPVLLTHGVKMVKYTPLDANFRLATVRTFMMEVQLCRLLEYLLTFDIRCQSLMTLAYYWADANHAEFGKPDSFTEKSFNNLPEPMTLQWLVIFFLCHQNLIPTPREICSRKHKKFFDSHTGKEIGFHCDSQYAKRWRSLQKSANSSIIILPPEKEDSEPSEEFTYSVLQLFQEFLQFCGSDLACDSWILNIRDGELICTDKFLTCAPNKTESVGSSMFWTTKMSDWKLNILGSQHTNQFKNSSKTKEMKDASKRIHNSIVESKEQGLYIIHPFNFAWKFSVSDEMPNVLKLMKSSGQELKQFLDVWKRDGDEEANKRFGSLENVLTAVTNTQD